jgi:hypothetical protein
MNHAEYIEEIKAAILNVHSSRSEYLETVPVTEVFQGQTIWEGEVEVFELKDHPKATKAYAWGYSETESDDARTYVTVLELPPVESPETAVRASIVRDYRDEQKQKH